MKFEITQESMLLLVVMLFLMFLVNTTSQCEKISPNQTRLEDR